MNFHVANMYLYIVDNDRRQQLTSKLSELEQIKENLESKIKDIEKNERGLKQKLEELRYARVSTHYQWCMID